MKLPHQFIRTIFYLALGCAVLSVLLVLLVLCELNLPLWVEGLIAYFILTSFGGLFASIILANFVYCRSCEGKAMVFPNSTEITPDTENLYQPWRKDCGRCGEPL